MSLFRKDAGRAFNIRLTESKAARALNFSGSQRDRVRAAASSASSSARNNGQENTKRKRGEDLEEQIGKTGTLPTGVSDALAKSVENMGVDDEDFNLNKNPLFEDETEQQVKDSGDVSLLQKSYWRQAFQVNGGGQRNRLC